VTPSRIVWAGAGLVSVGLGGLGIIVPGLPTTVFFIVAAWCFSKSSPRLERWVLNLPKIGPMVQRYRAGERMPRKAKMWAIASIVAFAGAAVVFAIDNLAVRLVVAAFAVVGIAVVMRA
jgi:uncharacterized membrane protein YbaN (DUF454 family)